MISRVSEIGSTDGKLMSKPTNLQPVPSTGGFRRFLPLIMIGLAMVAVLLVGYLNGWARHLQLENVVAIRDRFQAFLTDYRLAAVIIYIAVYAAAVALSMPGALLLTLSGGLMFGWLLGGLSAVVGATLGACIIFLVARSALGETLQRRAGPLVQKLQAGFQENALSYLLFLRLVPAFPFFLVNIVPAVLGVPFRTYVIGTFFGIIPGTMAFASVGAGFDSVLAQAKASYDACVATSGAAACALSIDASSLLTTEIRIAFVLLGIMALIPVVLKKLRGTQ